MRCQTAERLLEQIDDSITNILGFDEASLLEKSYLAKFLIVYICGIYEESIEQIFNERISELNSQRLNTFFVKNLKRSFRNPNVDNVRQLLKKFDRTWEREIANLPHNIKQSLNDICENKNYLAHGTVCTITLREVIQLYNDSKQIIQKIDEIVCF